MIIILILIGLLAVFHATLIDYLYDNPDYYQLSAYTWESDDFRLMKLGELVASQEALDYETLSALMIDREYDLTGIKEFSADANQIKEKKPVEFQKLAKAYENLLSDLKYFPIPSSANKDTPDIKYSDGWMENREYGGERGHEGCDLMGTERERGYYPVVSISDGVVEKVGWLEKGGWRIGVRTPSGVYLYYAHLYSYSREWKAGDTVRAGELLGFMGDTGYSSVEGTVGNFEVHLHLGIYIKTDHYQELSVNPYWILRYLEKSRQKSSY